MGAAKKIRMILLDKDLTARDLSVMAGKSKQTVYNLLSRDSMSFATVEELLDAIDCEVVFRDRRTKKLYD